MSHQRHNGSPGSAGQVYSRTARRFHWWTAALVVILLGLGFAMTFRAYTLDKFDGLTNAMFSMHKALGFALLWLMLVRLVYRLRHGAPPPEPGLASWQIGASHTTHWLLYGLLIVMPIGGWVGVSLYGARDIFGLISLPAIAPVDQGLSEKVFKLHTLGGYAVLMLVAAHIGAALYHRLMLRDRVLARMWPDRDGQA